MIDAERWYRKKVQVSKQTFPITDSRNQTCTISSFKQRTYSYIFLRFFLSNTSKALLIPPFLSPFPSLPSLRILPILSSNSQSAEATNSNFFRSAPLKQPQKKQEQQKMEKSESRHLQRPLHGYEEEDRKARKDVKERERSEGEWEASRASQQQEKDPLERTKKTNKS